MFVRTKEKVYEVVEENERYYKCCYDDGCITLVAKFDNDENGFSKALKTADNIEELCDGFYWDCEDGFSIHNFMSYPIAKDTWDEYVSDCLIDEEKIEANMYGCIKTSKGLIYVAKMNDKGELELI